MLERFTSGAREVVTAARGNALRLGHRWIGCEHLLLALSASDSQAGLILRGQGVTPERVRVEAVRLAGAGRGVSLFDVLDADALAAIGIDLDAVRGKVEAAFGPGALTAAPARRPPGRRWADRLTRRARRVRRSAQRRPGGRRAGAAVRAPGPNAASTLPRTASRSMPMAASASASRTSNRLTPRPAPASRTASTRTRSGVTPWPRRMRPAWLSLADRASSRCSQPIQRWPRRSAFPRAAVTTSRAPLVNRSSIIASRSAGRACGARSA